MTADASLPRCSNCWAPLRRDKQGRWVNDEAVSKPTCMLPGRPHRVRTEIERWVR
ncbi:hypothetical protein [Pseudonocardia humida]|uniref:Uncharacterized protein n=1 Tax=Pseudonocardia humida TaxID=2800819 RepID=A0ABT1A1T1_9PSEU|nr:hypothetical protein [Pseudonocardia humida]MCO1656971.1 hypothetical protein [Pseudonocardia humida]